MHLPFHELGVDDAAAVVHGHIPQESDGSRLPVYFHHHHMGAKGIGVPGERVRTTKLQSFLDSWRQAFCIVRSGGQLGESNILLQVGAMEDPSSLEGELLGRAVEQM